MVIAARQHGLARGRAQCRRVEAVELKSTLRQTLGRWRVDDAAERTRRRKADIVKQNDKHIRRALGRAQRLDRRELGVRILAS